MDLLGLNPTGEAGTHFRNSIWWWRPLWDYARSVAPDAAKAEGVTNDGEQISAEDALRLAEALRQELATGRTAETVESMWNEKAQLPSIRCDLCSGTGVRTDKVGVEHGMPTKQLEPALRILTGRAYGWCNGCDGEGRRQHHLLNYQFDEENVENFVSFLESCGGFEIW